MEILERDTAPLEKISRPFPRLTYDEAVRLLKEKGSPIVYGDDFGAPEETGLSEIFDRPVCVTHFPAKIKAFYMQPDQDRPDLALGVDFWLQKALAKSLGVVREFMT